MPRSPTTDRLRRRAWGLWAAACLRGICLACWPLIVLAPSTGAARRVARVGARAWFALVGLPVRRELQPLAGLSRPAVLVANHASKFDTIVLTAFLPLSFAFVAKAELAQTWWLRWPLRRLGALFVQRGAHPATTSATQQAIERVRRGDHLLFFPEGTVGDRPGLLPFHGGAFVTAAQTAAPVVPIAVRGTRAVWPDLRGLPVRGAIELQASAPMEDPQPDPVPAAAALQRAARAFLAAHCGEPDLASEPQAQAAPR